MGGLAAPRHQFLMFCHDTGVNCQDAKQPGLSACGETIKDKERDGGGTRKGEAATKAVSDTLGRSRCKRSRLGMTALLFLEAACHPHGAHLESGGSGGSVPGLSPSDVRCFLSWHMEGALSTRRCSRVQSWTADERMELSSFGTEGPQCCSSLRLACVEATRRTYILDY